MKRILLVDDHPMIVRGLKSVLADALSEAEFGMAGDPDEALLILRGSHWDVVILDLNLPKRGGFELIRCMKEVKPKVPILIYSMHSEGQFGLRAVQAGADGFLSKDCAIEEVAQAVQLLLQGKPYIRECLATSLMELARGGSTEGGLSDRETQVLRMIAGGKTQAQIAESLSLSTKSIATYRSRMLEKLGLTTTAELIRYAMEHDLG